jgi:hypothetical protein
MYSNEVSSCAYVFVCVRMCSYVCVCVRMCSYVFDFSPFNCESPAPTLARMQSTTATSADAQGTKQPTCRVSKVSSVSRVSRVSR